MKLENDLMEELKLYCVTLDHSVYVLATDEKSALMDGCDGIKDEAYSDHCYAREIDVSREDLWIEPAWMHNIPYGERVYAHSDMTVQEVIDALKAELPDPRQMDLLEALKAEEAPK